VLQTGDLAAVDAVSIFELALSRGGGRSRSEATRPLLGAQRYTSLISRFVSAVWSKPQESISLPFMQDCPLQEHELAELRAAHRAPRNVRTRTGTMP